MKCEKGLFLFVRPQRICPRIGGNGNHIGIWSER